MLKSVLLLSLLVAVFAASEPKILGHRTETNFPSAWTLADDVPSGNTRVTFLVALKERNLDVLEKLFWAVSDPENEMYRKFLSLSEIEAITNPASEDISAVISWLHSHGVYTIKNMGSSLKVEASLDVASKLFNTEFRKFINNVSGKSIVRQFGQFSIPTEVADKIELVLGLSEFPVPKFGVKRASQMKRHIEQNGPSIAPQSVANYYGTTGASVSLSNNSVGVIEFEDQYFAPSDLQAFAQSFNLQIAPVTAAHTIGTNDPTNPQLEATLDIQYVLGVAPGAVGWFWIENDSVWLYGFATHILQTNPTPYVVSISYGWNEEAQCEQGIGSSECSQLGVNSQQYVALVNGQFQKIGLRGISLVCASGDSGANGRTDPYCTESHLNPVFPAASPYITSVGATQIDATKNNGGTPLSNPPPGCSGYTCTGSGGYEESVSYDQANFASGGGFSNVASTPSYQTAAVSTYLQSGVKLPPSTYYNANGRGFPDISAFGSNILISSSGQIEPVGGTSASSPIYAAVFTLLNDHVLKKTGKPLGFLNPLLYQMASKCGSACFNDITTGDNICTEEGCSQNCQGYLAAVGWDPVSGLGSPKYQGMLNYVNNLLDINA